MLWEVLIVTGMALFDKAMAMLGYASSEGLNGKEDMLKKSLTFINLIYAELYYPLKCVLGDNEFQPLTAIGQEIKLPKIILDDVAPYGLAMYLAQSESDADNQSLFASLYNQKRARSLYTGRVCDKLPHVWG